ncbi:MAG: hypothetical protein U1E48_05485 [Paracoccaceae bacterium]
MRRVLWLLVLLWSVALPAAAVAGRVTVQAGDHLVFTRLVLQGEGRSDWKLGRTAQGYALQVGGAEVAFDLGGLFARIDRRRIADVTADGPGRLAIALGCDCHATAFAMSGGRIVVDIGDGAPARDSPFEVELAPPDAGPTPASSPVAGTEAPRAAAATLTFLPLAAPAANPAPDWHGSASTVVLGPGSAPVTSAPAAVKDAERPAAAPQLPVPGTQLPVMVAPPPVLPPDISGPAIRATEDALLLQLGRAASQGLVEPPAPVTPPPARPDAPPPEPADAAPAMGGPDDDRDPPPGAGAIAFHAETSLDRDSREDPAARHLTASGGSCVPDSEVALAEWGSADPVPAQLASVRAGLVGEFDRPDARAVERLAKLYLFLGMGAEARQVLAAFSADLVDARLLSDIGLVLDDGVVAQDSPLHGMRDCDTQVALWSFLAAPSGNDVRLADTGAVARGFSGLPAGLRHILARRLASRLTEIGATDAARRVRNAVARESQPGDRLVGMLDAERALRNGKPSAAESPLDSLTAGNDPLSAEAVLLAVEARLKQGAAPPPGLVEAVSALAFERRDGADGPRFTSAAILALAAGGKFDEAFASYGRWQTEKPDADRRETAEGLFGLLAGKADDATFLQDFFAGTRMLAEAGAEAPVRLAVARRLVSLGFADEARGLVSPVAAGKTDGRMVLAGAALGQMRPDEALGDLQGLEGPEAGALRAAALSMAGRHGEAAAIYAAQGDLTAAADAAWAAGDWEGAARSDRFRQAAAGLGLTAAAGPASEAGTTLAGSRALLDQSAGVRQILTDLLDSPAPPQTRPAGP